MYTVWILDTNDTANPFGRIVQFGNGFASAVRHIADAYGINELEVETRLRANQIHDEFSAIKV